MNGKGVKEIAKEALEEEAKDLAHGQYDVALRIAIKLIKMFEGCELVAYPDPASDLYKSLVKNNLLRKWKSGGVTFDMLEKDMQKLQGTPWTCGYGETEGVKCGDIWTQEQADEALEREVKKFIEGVLKACPQLKQESQERVAACVSFAYNIGASAFSKSGVCKKTQEKCYGSAAESFMQWTKAKGVELPGLVKRRQIERDMYLAQGV